MLTISIYRENLFSIKILLQRRISFCATIYYRTYLKRQPSAEKQRLQFWINHPFYLIIQTVYFHFLCFITAGKLYTSQHSNARAKQLQQRAFTEIARISSRMYNWWNDTTKKTSNTLQVLIMLWVCYLNMNDFGSWLGIRRISTIDIQLLPCILRLSALTVNVEFLLMSRSDCDNDLE